MEWQGKAWEVSQSVSHGGSLPNNWMIENSIVGASAGVLHASPADFLQLFRTEAVRLIFKAAPWRECCLFADAALPALQKTCAGHRTWKRG